MKKPFIPFEILPGSWGLKGKTREVAKAEYELSGIDLEYRLAEIYADNETTADLEKLSIKLSHGLISEFEFKTLSNKMQPGLLEVDRTLADLKIKLEYDMITKHEFNKKKATLLKEPYVEVIEINLDKGSSGYIELDWNDEFIKSLHEQGFTALSDEDLVNQWFNNLCRTVLINEMQDQDYGLESLDAPSNDVIYRRDLVQAKKESIKKDSDNVKPKRPKS